MRASHIRGPPASPCDPDTHGQLGARSRLHHSTLGLIVIKEEEEKEGQLGPTQPLPDASKILPMLLLNLPGVPFHLIAARIMGHNAS